MDERSTAGAQGWNIDYLALTHVSCKYSSFGSVESSRLVAAPGTLLGPEGSGIELTFRPVNGLGPSLRTNHCTVLLNRHHAVGAGTSEGPPVP